MMLICVPRLKTVNTFMTHIKGVSFLKYPFICQYRIWLAFHGPLFNTMRPRQNGCQFADDIFKCILLNENVWIRIKDSLKFVPKVPINNIPALVQIMAWRRPGDKPLSEPMLVSLLMHICVTLPQWVNWFDLTCEYHGKMTLKRHYPENISLHLIWK